MVLRSIARICENTLPPVFPESYELVNDWPDGNRWEPSLSEEDEEDMSVEGLN
jgi:hypothetical protein